MNTLTEKERKSIENGINIVRDKHLERFSPKDSGDFHFSERAFINEVAKDAAKNVCISLAELRKEEAPSEEQIPLGFNVYKKTATVMAKLFEKGDEDGMIHREGMIGAMEDAKYGLQPDLIPYVSTLENKFLQGDFGKNYLCVGIDGERWLVEKSIFERTYEIAKLLTPDVNADTVTKKEMFDFMQYVLIRRHGDEINPTHQKKLYEQFKNLPQKL